MNDIHDENQWDNTMSQIGKSVRAIDVTSQIGNADDTLLILAPKCWQTVRQLVATTRRDLPRPPGPGPPSAGGDSVLLAVVRPLALSIGNVTLISPAAAEAVLFLAGGEGFS
eukprot:Polyplicarium_translucidae@DN528_c0_g1_i2.p3